MTPTQKAAMEQMLAALEYLKNTGEFNGGWRGFDSIAVGRAALAETAKPFGHVTVRRLSQRFQNHVDQYQFYPAGERPYLDNVDECHAVYTAPQPPAQWCNFCVKKVGAVCQDRNQRRECEIELPKVAPQTPAPAGESDDLTIAYMAGYHAAKKAPAVELTDEELRQVVNQTVDGVTVEESVLFRAVARAAIAAHEAKKGGVA